MTREVTPPLDVLTAITDRLLDALAIGDPLRDQVQRASDQVRRLTEFTRHLSAVSRRRRGRASRVDVADAIAETMPALRGALEPAIRVEASPTRGWVTLIDPMDLRTMLMDLAVNARDAMPGGGCVRIEVGRVDLDADAAVPLTVRPGSYVRLLVRDSGRGIPRDAQAHLFEPFFSTKGEEGTDSTPGLALASLYATVTQYGGCVSVTSEPGEGSAFEMLLPAA